MNKRERSRRRRILSFSTAFSYSLFTSFSASLFSLFFICSFFSFLPLFCVLFIEIKRRRSGKILGGLIGRDRREKAREKKENK
jgi:hypothetical protein